MKLCWKNFADERKKNIYFLIKRKSFIFLFPIVFLYNFIIESRDITWRAILESCWRLATPKFIFVSIETSSLSTISHNFPIFAMQMWIKLGRPRRGRNYGFSRGFLFLEKRDEKVNICTFWHEAFPDSSGNTWARAYLCKWIIDFLCLVLIGANTSGGQRRHSQTTTPECVIPLRFPTPFEIDINLSGPLALQ